MLTILLLACKSDQGLQNNNQNPGRSLDQEACECPDSGRGLRVRGVHREDMAFS
jgi:hypothetical protein